MPQPIGYLVQGILHKTMQHFTTLFVAKFLAKFLVCASFANPEVENER